MAITSSGAICDVCGKYILPIDPEERVNTFSCAGFARELHCDNACKLILQAAFKAGDWKQLPDGPLRTAFEERASKEAKNES